LLTSTTSFGKLFQILTIRAEKQYFRLGFKIRLSVRIYFKLRYSVYKKG